MPGNARLPLVLVLVASGVLGACKTEEEKLEDQKREKIERANRIEARYGVTSPDARALAESHPELDESKARDLFAEFREKIPGFTRLAADDEQAFIAAVASDGLAESMRRILLSPEGIDLMRRIRERTVTDRVIQEGGSFRKETVFRYEPRLREVFNLEFLLQNKAKVDPLFARGGDEGIKRVLERVPRARLPLPAIPPAARLGAASPDALEHALDRFAELEIDLGVVELKPPVIGLLAAVAVSPEKLRALTVVTRNLPRLSAERITYEGLDAVAAIPAEALARVLAAVSGTGSFRRFVLLDERTAAVLAVLAKRPSSAALLGVIEATSPELEFEGVADARALVAIDSASPEGRAATLLEPCLARGQVVIEALDPSTTTFLTQLVARPELRDAIPLLRQAWLGWHAQPSELDGIAAVASAPAGQLVPLLASVRQLGFELSRVRLSPDCGRTLALLANEGASPLAEALHVLYPKLTVPDVAALRELHELAKTGITSEDILRLDAGFYSGSLDATVRTGIADRAIKRRSKPSPR